MKHLSRKVLLITFMLQLSLSCHAVAGAQQLKHNRRTILGTADRDILYPVPEGESGHKDAQALDALMGYLAQSAPPKGKGVDATGVLTTGSANEQKQLPVSFAISAGDRFRLDVERPNGTHSFRINGGSGHAQQAGERSSELDDTDGFEPLAFPMILVELLNRKDTSLVDDGTVSVDEQQLHKFTLSFFDRQFGQATGIALYFNNSDHTLRKSAVVGHSRGSRSLTYVKVMTYGDYREEDSLLLPHEYSESINGQPTMSLKVTSFTFANSHDDSYFSF